MNRTSIYLIFIFIYFYFHFKKLLLYLPSTCIGEVLWGCSIIGNAQVNGTCEYDEFAEAPNKGLKTQ